MELPAAEVQFWREYRAGHGFPTERVVAATAIAGAYAGAGWGGKATPSDLMPDFGGSSRRRKAAALAAHLSSIPGATVRRSKKRGGK